MLHDKLLSNSQLHLYIVYDIVVALIQTQVLISVFQCRFYYITPQSLVLLEKLTAS